jgi:hypothetical protein
VKIDLDADDRELPRWVIERRLDRAGFRLVRLLRRRSPSGAGVHLVARVRPRPESAAVVVALQAILGSDGYREACNLRRARILHRMPKPLRRFWNQLYGRVGP